MRIPKTIKIGGIEYSIELVEEAKDEVNGAEYIGRVLFKENKIKILSSYSEEKQYRTLLHEIIHVLDEDLKVGLEEKDICRLEVGLYQVLNDNKLLKE